MSEEFRLGWPEIKAVALAVAIITTWAVIRYGRAMRARGHGREPEGRE